MTECPLEHTDDGQAIFKVHMEDELKRDSFDLALLGAQDALDRITDGTPSFRRSAMEVVWWLGSAIDSMCLQYTTGGIHAGVYWVRNLGAHDMFAAMRAVENLAGFSDAFSSGFQHHYAWRSLEDLGYSEPRNVPGQTHRTQKAGYKLHLEGHNVHHRLAIAHAELLSLRSTY